MNRRKFLQILGLAAAAPSAVVAARRAKPVEVVRTRDRVLQTGFGVEETRFAPLDFRIYEQHRAALVRRAAGGA